MEQQIIKISSSELLSETIKLKNNGYRLVAISCTSKDNIEVSYSFDKDYDFINLRLILEEDVEIESISLIYPYAFLYENEIKELFGVKINNIALDYKDTLYKIAVKTPFKKKEKE